MTDSILNTSNAKKIVQVRAEERVRIKNLQGVSVINDIHGFSIKRK